MNYKIDNFMISFESSIRTEKISNNPGIGDKVFKGITKLKYASTSGDFSFRVRNSTVTGVEKIDKIQMTNRYGTLDITDLAGADGYIQITLDASRSTDIKVYCTDSDGEHSGTPGLSPMNGYWILQKTRERHRSSVLMLQMRR